MLNISHYTELAQPLPHLNQPKKLLDVEQPEHFLSHF